MSLERLWAGWRSEYVTGAGHSDDCVFCRILASDEPGETTYIVRRDETCAVILNAYPYTSGHLMVMPVRHVADLEDLDADEARGLWRELAEAVRALKSAYSPDGLNVGANLGRSAGAGVPGHFHMHCVPRWNGDTNFMTTLAETRMLPESLPATYEKVSKAWPADG
ncbi:MAG TPA: HIT domain-containing protein [Acidimicrobiales bacterium]|jgi:ATP adenylyltransferase|nr:HIT domain-containing protein [Acidimicrobiales bacterium]